MPALKPGEGCWQGPCSGQGPQALSSSSQQPLDYVIICPDSRAPRQSADQLEVYLTGTACIR